MMAAPPDVKRPAPSVADGSGAEADHAGKLISSVDSKGVAAPQYLLRLDSEPGIDGVLVQDEGARWQREALSCASRHAGAAHRHLIAALQFLDGIGIELDYDLAGELENLRADLRLIASGRASIADLRKAGLPEWAAEVTIRWRAERDRRRRPQPSVMRRAA